MGVAKLFPGAPDKGGRGKTAKLSFGVSNQYLARARFVFHHAPDLVEPVLVGAAAIVALGLHREGKRRNGRWEYGALKDAAPSENGGSAESFYRRLREAGLVLDILGVL